MKGGQQLLCCAADIYKGICKYFVMGPMDEQISARQSKVYLRYCATENAVCHAISKLR